MHSRVVIDARAEFERRRVRQLVSDEVQATLRRSARRARIVRWLKGGGSALLGILAAALFVALLLGLGPLSKTLP